MLYEARWVYVWSKSEVPEVLLHIPALAVVPLVQEPQDVFLERLGTLILGKLRDGR